MNPTEHRPYTAPQVATPLTSAEYKRGEDPAMKAILGYGARKTLSDLLAPSLPTGDTGAVLRVVRAYRADPPNAYRNVEGEVNRLGYDLLGAGRIADALLVFRANAAEFPQSANVFDSMGEGYLRAGRRVEAIAAYREALRLAPRMPSAIAALRQFGVQP